MRKKEVWEEKEKAAHKETGLVTGLRTWISNLSSKRDYMRLEKSIYTPLRGSQGTDFPPKNHLQNYPPPSETKPTRDLLERTLYTLYSYLIYYLLYCICIAPTTKLPIFSTTPLPDYLYSEIDNWFISSVYSDLRFLRDWQSVILYP